MHIYGILSWGSIDFHRSRMIEISLSIDEQKCPGVSLTPREVKLSDVIATAE